MPSDCIDCHVIHSTHAFFSCTRIIATAKDPHQQQESVLFHLLGGSELNALLDLAREVGGHLGDLLLLIGVGALGSSMDLGDTLLAEVNLSGEEGSAVQLLVLGGLDESKLLLDVLASETSENAFGELGTCSGHGESSRTATGLGLDDLITAEHDALGDGLELLALEVKRSRSLGEERDNGGAGVTTNDRDRDSLTSLLASKGVGTELIKSGDTKELLGVVSTGLLQRLGPDGNGGVNRVGNDEESSVGALLGTLGSNSVVNVGIDVEEIVTGHAGLAGDTSGDDDNVSTLESSAKVLRTSEALHLD